MIATILVIQALTLGALLFLLFRKRIVVKPSQEWLAISEQFTQEFWNTIIDHDKQYLDLPIHSLLESEDTPAGALPAAFEKGVEECLRISMELASANPFGVDPNVVGYSLAMSEWFAQKARNFGSWTELAKVDAESAKGGWGEVAKEAVVGGIKGFFGGWIAIPKLLADQQARFADEDMENEALMRPVVEESERLEFQRAVLSARAQGVQKHLEAQFGWSFDDSVE